ncbi:MAG: hypothetical protein ACLUNV_11745 [Sutterella wadsworthensis]
MIGMTLYPECGPQPGSLIFLARASGVSPTMPQAWVISADEIDSRVA